MQGRFARVTVWASHGYTQRQHQGACPREWLLVEWTLDQEAPYDYWLAHLPERQTPTLQRLVGLARERWRVEQGYRELKEELGLDHSEGRSWLGWHHHVSLSCLAHLFLQGERTARPTAADAQRKPGSGRRATRPPKACRKPAAVCPPRSGGWRARTVPGVRLASRAPSNLAE